MSVNGHITHISRGSLHDGPGVRTVVYFKGCGLRCRWCHNPETFTGKQQVLYAPVKCIHCGRCIALCPEHHQIDGTDMVFVREGCAECGKCADTCPSGALSVCGSRMELDDVMREVRKDIPYYRESGGGVTLSGGECLLQAEFAAELLARCRQEGIHTAIETALFVSWEQVEQLLPYVDLVYADCKIPDPERHREYTGQDNRLILENLRRLCGDPERQVIIRIPLIPGVNDRMEDMAGFGSIFRSLGKGLKEVELLRYNSLAESKYQLAGMEYEGFGSGPQSKETMEQLRDILQAQVDPAVRVFFRPF